MYMHKIQGRQHKIFKTTQQNKSKPNRSKIAEAETLKYQEKFTGFSVCSKSIQDWTSLTHYQTL